MFGLWVRINEGFKGRGFLGLVDIGIKGWLFMMVDVFVRNVVSILCVKFFGGIFNSMELRMCLVILMRCFYIFLKWEEWGGLNSYIILFLYRYFFMGLFLIFIVLMWRLFVVLMKFVFLLECICLILFLMVIKCLKVLINDDEDIFLMILICIFLLIMYVKRMVYFLVLVVLFFVFLVIIF